MTITETITARWDDLSERAQARIRASRPQLLRRWELIEEGHSYATTEADTAAEALEEARGNVDAGNYGNPGKTIWVDIEACNLVTGESESDTVACDPDEPECTESDHDWQAPFSVLGGLKENPGVWGHGGGTIRKRVCAHCGRYRITDTWAQRPDTGEQGLTSVEYEDADEASEAWIAERAREAHEAERASLRESIEAALEAMPQVTRYVDGEGSVITTVTAYDGDAWELAEAIEGAVRGAQCVVKVANDTIDIY